MVSSYDHVVSVCPSVSRARFVTAGAIWMKLGVIPLGMSFFSFSQFDLFCNLWSWKSDFCHLTVVDLCQILIRSDFKYSRQAAILENRLLPLSL
jgi:hypothetical protein